MKTCLNDACKAENVESAKFCSKCGFKFNEQTLQQNEPKKVEAPIADIQVENAADIQVQSPEKKSTKKYNRANTANNYKQNTPKFITTIFPFRKTFRWII